jgi:serine/threonine-protein kinase
MVDDRDALADAQVRIGTILCGKYRLDAVIGVGGMATVYAATHRNRAELAIKILHHDLASEPGVRTRFLLEACSANSVKHQGVVKVVDDDVAEDGSAFLVMDRLKGSTAEELRERRGGKLGLHAAVAIVDQLLEVLAAAHAEGIVHRDVKPANLFVTTHGEVKVLDFGIARTREALPNDLCVTGAATIMGTPTYMAPEQALPGMTEIDERTDLWAAGATLFALVSGHTVHEGETAGDVVFKAATEPGRSLASVAPATPCAIAEVVDCALSFEKSARWGSADEMRTALRAAYRLHFGRAPSRTSLAVLRDPAASEVDSADTLVAPRFPGWIAHGTG